MARSLFDPLKAAGAETAATPRDAHLTVTQASELIKTTLETKLPSSLKVVGQVSNLKTNNHWYFSLKDERSVLPCVAWATAAQTFGFAPRDGDEVVATGHISHYGPQGKTQMYIDGLQPVGAGALELKFRAMCEQLRGLGYFDDARKKLLPLFPRRIAVITSKTGAAITDVIATAAQRCRAVGVLVVDVRVQGDGAAEDVAAAIRFVDRHRVRLGVDAMLVTRGGGSIEDLWAFNERIVADAVFKCHLPVVAAIGHESDTTIIELVADVRASTPTQAIVRLIPSSAELCRHLDHLMHRLGSMLKRAIERQRQRLSRGRADGHRIARSRVHHERIRCARLSTMLAQMKPTAQLAQRQARLAVVRDRLSRVLARRVMDFHAVAPRLQLRLHEGILRHLRAHRQRHDGRLRHLAAIDPRNVLNRGFSITRRADGAFVRSVSQVKRMDAIVTMLKDGEFKSVVGESTRRERAQTHASDQLDLFGINE